MDINNSDLGEKIWCAVFVIVIVINVCLWVILSAAWV